MDLIIVWNTFELLYTVMSAAFTFCCGMLNLNSNLSGKSAYRQLRESYALSLMTIQNEFSMNLLCKVTCCTAIHSYHYQTCALFCHSVREMPATPPHQRFGICRWPLLPSTRHPISQIQQSCTAPPHLTLFVTALNETLGAQSSRSRHA